MSEPTGHHLEIYKFLLENFAGIDKAAKRSAVLQRFNLVHKKEITDRDFRAVISELIVVYKKPICTAPSSGYYVAIGEAEKDIALHYLDSLLTEIGDRRRALAAAVPLAARPRQERLF